MIETYKVEITEHTLERLHKLLVHVAECETGDFQAAWARGEDTSNHVFRSINSLFDWVATVRDDIDEQKEKEGK